MFKTILLSRVARQLCKPRSFSAAADGEAAFQGSRVVLSGERGVNKATLIGRVGSDPQIRGSPENSVTVFPLATSYTLKTREGEFVQKTEWHRISVFRPVLKDLVAKFVQKGDRVYVSGSISYGQFKDKNDVVQKVTSIVADEVMDFTRPLHGGGSDANPAEFPEEETTERM